MKIVKKSQTKIFANSEYCTAIEYPLNDKDINGAVIKLRGRYPNKGVVINLKCKELAYVIKGSGKLVVEDEEIQLDAGDLALIEPNEKYFWKGNMILFTPCTPAWYPEQHQQLNK